MLLLNTIRPQPGATRPKKRLGRGAGSGHGVTSGKGDKGQLARSGGTTRPGFEGGQTPLYRRLPKQGFRNPCRRSHVTLNLSDLERLEPTRFPEVTLDRLVEANVVKGRYDRLVILGEGKLTKSLTIRAHRVSASARAAITQAGGKVELVPTPGAKPRAKRK